MTTTLSIIIVNYNTKNLTIDCIESVYKFTKKINFEIILVDNNSIDDSISEVKKKFPKVKIIANKKNVGFGTANNQAAKLAKGKYLLFLNSDTYLLEDSIDQMISWMDSHPDADASTCISLNPDRSLQYSIGFFPDLARIIAWLFFVDDLPIFNRIFPSYHLENKHWYKNIRVIDWAQGSFLLLKNEVFSEINGFDEKMFMYGEEVEMQLRLKKRGSRIYFIPNTSIVHLGRASSNQISSSFTIISELNGLIYIYNKHHAPWKLPVLKLLLRLGILLRLIIFEHIFQKKQLKGVYSEALAKI